MATNREIIEVSVKGAKKAKKQLGGVNSSLSSMAKKVGIASAAYFGASGLISGFKKLSEEGSKLKNVTQAFDNMGTKIGFTSASLSKLKQATNGTISEIQLMTKANNAMALSIVGSDEEMAELFDTAQRLGAALGVDTTRALDSLVTGMGRQSKLMLDNLGIMVDAKVAYETYAVSVGKASNELDDNEKKIAFNNEAMRQAKDIVNSMGPELETSNMRMEELGATFADMTADLGKALSPALENLTSKFVVAGMAVADFMRKNAEDDAQTAIRNLKELGADTTQLELSYVRLQKSTAIRELGGVFTRVGINSNKIKLDNEKIVALQIEKNSHVQEGVDLETRILEATEGKVSLENLIAKKIDQSTSRKYEQELLDLMALEREKELHVEKTKTFEEDIENLNNEVEKREELIALRIQEQALSKSTSEIENKKVDDTIKGEEKASKFKEKIDAVMLKNKSKVKVLKYMAGGVGGGVVLTPTRGFY